MNPLGSSMANNRISGFSRLTYGLDSNTFLTSVVFPDWRGPRTATALNCSASILSSVSASRVIITQIYNSGIEFQYCKKDFIIKMSYLFCRRDIAGFRRWLTPSVRHYSLCLFSQHFLSLPGTNSRQYVFGNSRGSCTGGADRTG